MGGGGGGFFDRDGGGGGGVFLVFCVKSALQLVVLLDTLEGGETERLL